MSLQSWTASRELDSGLFASLYRWLSSLFNMLAISSTPKPLHIQPSDSSSSSDNATPAPDSITSFTPTPTTAAPPTNATTASSSISSSQQESQTHADMFVKPAPSTPSSGSRLDSSKASKRPKLSLQTSSLPMTYGKSTTALSLALSAGCSPSPTVRNTFSNAYDGFRRTASSPVGTGSSSPKCGSRSGKRGSSYLCNYQTTNEDVPYKLPLGVRSILRNSPLHTSSLRRPSLSASTNNGSANGHSARKALFPAKRQVKYRYPLDEEIKTVHYVARHSDLSFSDSPSGPSDIDTSSEEESDSSLSQSKSSPSDDDDSSFPSLPQKDKDMTNSSDRDKNSNIPSQNPARQRPRTKRKHSTSERQIRAIALREDLAGSGTYDCFDNTPQTPLLHKRQKHPRKWRWTLGPVENGHVLPVNSSNAPDPATSPPPVSAPDVPAAAPVGEVPLLNSPSPKRRQGSLTGAVLEPNTTTTTNIDTGAFTTTQPGRDQGTMIGDVLHEASSLPLPHSLRSSPGPS
ncbi:hypothetical protein AJ79_06286 [Helicocarpus griseus UAMH5409]|uniref:Uncharacterized protein n=1 Tax=Helicocarpus griseus UAMH5409 TaxID=1447875 RepID=A0A2B7X6V6_9EURO|nr:hypothetical protein AJ79_06286 [Helicocarpus griseus UAMH5409]